VVTGKDKAAIFTWYRYAGLHYETLSEHRRSGDEALDLRKVLVEMEQRLLPGDQAKRVKDAEAEMKRIRKLQLEVSRKLSRVDGREEQIRADVRRRLAGVL
jgi:hypothetical protein